VERVWEGINVRLYSLSMHGAWWYIAENREERQQFTVVVDWSGSLNRNLESSRGVDRVEVTLRPQSRQLVVALVGTAGWSSFIRLNKKFNSDPPQQIPPLAAGDTLHSIIPLDVHMGGHWGDDQV